MCKIMYDKNTTSILINTIWTIFRCQKPEPESNKPMYSGVTNYVSFLMSSAKLEHESKQKEKSLTRAQDQHASH